MPGPNQNFDDARQRRLDAEAAKKSIKETKQEERRVLKAEKNEAKRKAKEEASEAARIAAEQAQKAATEAKNDVTAAVNTVITENPPSPPNDNEAAKFAQNTEAANVLDTTTQEAIDTTVRQGFDEALLVTQGAAAPVEVTPPAAQLEAEEPAIDAEPVVPAEVEPVAPEAPKQDELPTPVETEATGELVAGDEVMYKNRSGESLFGKIKWIKGDRARILQPDGKEIFQKLADLSKIAGGAAAEVPEPAAPVPEAPAEPTVEPVAPAPEIPAEAAQENIVQPEVSAAGPMIEGLEIPNFGMMGEREESAAMAPEAPIKNELVPSAETGLKPEAEGERQKLNQEIIFGFLDSTKLLNMYRRVGKIDDDQFDVLFNMLDRLSKEYVNPKTSLGDLAVIQKQLVGFQNGLRNNVDKMPAEPLQLPDLRENKGDLVPADNNEITVTPQEIEEPIGPKEDPRQIEYNPKSSGELEVIPPKDLQKMEIKPEEVKKKREKMLIVDISEIVKAMAWREAEQKLRDMLDKNNSNFLKRTFVRLGEKGYLMKYYKEALAAIQSNKNLMAEIEARIMTSGVKSENKDKSYEILDAVLEEFTKEVVDADEKGDLVQDNEVNLVIGQLFADFATSKMTRAEFDQKVESDVVGLLKRKNMKFGAPTTESQAEGLMYANNLFAMAEGYRKQFEGQVNELTGEFGEDQKENIERQIKGEMALDIQLGLKQTDLYETKPKPVLKWYEKFVDATENIPYLNKIIANPVTYGVIGGIATSLTGKAASRFLGITVLVGSVGVVPYLAPLLVGAGLGGTFAAMRRSRDLQYDRGMDLRRTTLGIEVDAGAKRTEKMREFNYNLKRAEECQQNLEALMAKDGLTDDDKKAIADIIARLKVEKEKQVDLIGVSEAEGEAHKTKLIAMKDLKVTLKEVWDHFNLTDAEMQGLVDAAETDLISNIESNDKSFDSYKHKQMFKSGLIGAITGVVAGGIGQWLGGQFSEHVFGRVPKTESALEHLAHYIKGDHSTPGSTISEHLTLSEGQLLNQRGEVAVDSLPVIDAKTGQIDPAALAELRAKGIIIDESQIHIPGSESAVSADQYIKTHPDSFHQIHHQGWFDNDTPKVFDKNELKLDFGGANGTGIDKQGNFVFNIAKMAKDGSFHNNFSVDAKDAMENGSLKMMLYLSDKTQGHALELSVSPDGNVIIPPDSEAAKLFMSVGKDGQAVFNGRFGEIVQSFGVDINGVEQIVPLATIVGKGVETPTMVEGAVDKFTYSFDAVTHIPPTDKSWDVPPILPFDPRRPLEGPRKKKNAEEGTDAANEAYRQYDGNISGSNLPDVEVENKTKTEGLADVSERVKDLPIVEGEVVGLLTDETNKKEVQVGGAEAETAVIEASESENKRLTLDDLILELKNKPATNEESSKKQKAIVREWLNGLTDEEVNNFNTEQEKAVFLLISGSYFKKKNSNEFADDESRLAYEKLLEKFKDTKVRTFFDKRPFDTTKSEKAPEIT